MVHITNFDNLEDEDAPLSQYLEDKNDIIAENHVDTETSDDEAPEQISQKSAKQVVDADLKSQKKAQDSINRQERLKRKKIDEKLKDQSNNKKLKKKLDGNSVISAQNTDQLLPQDILEKIQDYHDLNEERSKESEEKLVIMPQKRTSIMVGDLKVVSIDNPDSKNAGIAAPTVLISQKKKEHSSVRNFMNNRYSSSRKASSKAFSKVRSRVKNFCRNSVPRMKV